MWRGVEDWASERAVRSAMSLEVPGDIGLCFLPEFQSYVPAVGGSTKLTYFLEMTVEADLKDFMSAQLAAALASGSERLVIVDFGRPSTGDIAADVISILELDLGQAVDAISTCPVESLFPPVFATTLFSRPWVLDEAGSTPPRIQAVAFDDRQTWVQVSGVNSGFESCSLFGCQPEVEGAFKEFDSLFARHAAEWLSDSRWHLDPEAIESFRNSPSFRADEDERDRFVQHFLALDEQH